MLPIVGDTGKRLRRVAVMRAPHPHRYEASNAPGILAGANRRNFLKSAALGAASLAGGQSLELFAGVAEHKKSVKQASAYKYRIAFGAWINDMRLRPLPLENWPAPQFDDETIESAIRAMDVQADAGFNMLDVWGLFATYGWPTDIVSALEKDRRRRIQRLLKAANQRGIQVMLGLGTYSWGYDKILAADPAVRGKNADGSLHAHALCDANPKSFEYVKRIIDFALGEFAFGGVHLESCDLGCCFCPQCAGKDGVVGYNVRINLKTADYIKQHWPDRKVYVITINWSPPGKHFDAEQKAKVIELSKHIDCVFDQGHSGYHIAESERRDFIRQLHSAYGTSGKIWLYPDARWDRESYFLPYARRAGEALKTEYEDGVRGCLFYQGPVTNPGQEAMIAFGGRMLSNTARSIEDALGEVLERYYKPRNSAASSRLMRVFQIAEEAYFSQWSAELFNKVWGIPVPGEFKLDQNLFGTAPGPATYLKEPCLDGKGHREYRGGLWQILEELPKLKGNCNDGGRLAKIERCATIALAMLNTVCYSLGEPIQ